MKFTKEQFEEIYKFAFSVYNHGYNPEVIESPNGDGVWDKQKKYAHIAPKYLDYTSASVDHIYKYYNFAKEAANYICDYLNIPEQFKPGPDSTLRVLYYPPGATTSPHTDFNLFTICMYRNIKDTFKYLDGENDPLLIKAKEISPGIHLGELMTEINEAMATKHEVVGNDCEQFSAVFFATPSHEVMLPCGISVGDWIAERKNRSRKTL